MGLKTSAYTPPRSSGATADDPDAPGQPDSLTESFATLVRFLTDRDLTPHLASAEDIGRLNDVIDATVITRVLPVIVEPGERVV
ncbi:hypothetical protein [Nocardia asteroides]|uniref:Uncharacterized protein n=1 Tax=Nocardia asteroides NBRC 15531 TaxID=1110697 RepID=U5EHQ9_NOCAS|nr:hypothetical protein [Nocardia asteroides]UGT51215.1 hypothetical protein LT345_12045 [Nocardia asteroides]GAD85931.1 hypothetical protein NCAST_32_04160 [Nocardia asteroides NBRC 15531]